MTKGNMAQRKYPGINVNLRYPRGYVSIWGEQPRTYDVCGGWDDRLLSVREVFMMTLMDRLTDKPEWHKKVFDETIVGKWRKEALEQSEKGLFDEIVHKARKAVSNEPETDTAEDDDMETESMREWSYTRPETVPFPKRQRILSETAFDYCIRELRVKAAHFERTQLVPTLDSIGRVIAKSDTIVPDELKQSLREAFKELQEDQKNSNAIDWHPRTNNMVQDLVHPSLYPFIYGRSLFIQEEVVGVGDAVDACAGKGTTAPAVPIGELNGTGAGRNWSETYQWLPANLGFQDDGTVRFSSYINNLHPRKYQHVYRTIEKLIDLAIPAWDQVLGDCGRKEDQTRISQPKSADDDETEGLWEPVDPNVIAQSSLQPTKQDIRDMIELYEWEDEPNAEDDDKDQPKPETLEKWKWKHLREAIHPDPDDDSAIDYACPESLREIYKDSGLQVIVKMARIELTPEKPDFPAGGWHIEGMLNERICATALYYLDSENITSSSLAFRMETERDQNELNYAAGQDAYNWLERVYGANFREDLNLQYYGRVETREGRMLAFPNVFQHRVAPFSLEDRTKPGHRSFIALWLVDPSQPIVSTANVPPQQLDWWAEAVFGTLHQTVDTGNMPPEILQLLLEKQGLAEKLASAVTDASTKGNRLPNELVDMIRKTYGVPMEGLMSLEEAKEHRLRMMEERTAHEGWTNESSDIETYNFCEH